VNGARARAGNRNVRGLGRKDNNAGHNFYNFDTAVFRIVRTVCEILRWIEVRKMLDTIVSLAVCAALLAYLVYAMLRPEKF
jgi:K+-transporting ATPase KdpF subunit